MGDASLQASVVSNSSSRESIVGLAGAGANDASHGWDQSNISRSIISTMAQPSSQPDNQNLSSQSSTPSLTSTMPPNFPSTLIVAKNPLPILPSAGLTAPAAPTNNTVPEFLYQLTKMLTGGHNDIIEWSNGRIEVHSPHKLESIVLQKYFRHSKFASFQRQLNYFGFRKLAGKGKMAPCSYVNEAATQDIGSLLLIKRKTTTAPKDKNGRKQAAEKHAAAKAVHVPLNTAKGVVHQVRPGAATTAVATANYNTTTTGNVHNAPSANTQHAIAQAAVGRGIRHSIGFGGTSAASTATTEAKPGMVAPEQSNKFIIPTGVEDSLSQLANNYHNSLVDLPSYPDKAVSSTPVQGSQGLASSYSSSDPFPSLLSRNSSLVDLAMIPTLDDDAGDGVPTVTGMNFVDFPQPEVDPSKAYFGQAKQEQGPSS